jgi:hypothetical protein
VAQELEVVVDIPPIQVLMVEPALVMAEVLVVLTMVVVIMAAPLTVSFLLDAFLDIL